MMKRIDTEIFNNVQVLWHYHNIENNIEKADIILGLGTYDLGVAKKSVSLYMNDFAPYILFSGFLGPWTSKFWEIPESVVFRKIALSLGVPEKKIFIEDKSTNIGENIMYSRNLLFNKRLNAEKIIFVTKPNTKRRALAAVQKQWPSIIPFICSEDRTFDEHFNSFDNPDILINEIVGDIQRIAKYPAKGYQIEQIIPTQVIEAYNFLVSEGYDQHLVDNNEKYL